MLDSFSLGSRLGALVLAIAILYTAHKVHKSSGKHSKVTKPAGVVLAFLAGCGLLVTLVGEWMGNLASQAPAVAVGLLIVTVTIIVVDWLLDGRPDTAAFYAALILPILLVFGFANIGAAAGQVGEGASRVGDQVSQQVGD